MWNQTRLASIHVCACAACAQVGLSWQEKSCFQFHHSPSQGVADWQRILPRYLWTVSQEFNASVPISITLCNRGKWTLTVELMAARWWTALVDELANHLSLLRQNQKLRHGKFQWIDISKKNNASRLLACASQVQRAVQAWGRGHTRHLA